MSPGGGFLQPPAKGARIVMVDGVDRAAISITPSGALEVWVRYRDAGGNGYWRALQNPGDGWHTFAGAVYDLLGEQA
ncbi:MAG: hypothetical protein B7733_06150 [Myxococcales bacterium FL481]|nr:MAG: hypothetical protein B7733_06150 [Myxococcales bacterium FL481]